MTAGGPADQIDVAAGLRRARAATLLMLALPGSAYLYQGEELGLQEVADIPAEQRQDPAFFRGANRNGLGRDGCRVPLPWTRLGSSFGFGDGPAHLPQPAWFGSVSVEAQETDESSTLSLYRRALQLRRELRSEAPVEWIEELSTAHVLAFTRRNGWLNVTNFGGEAVPLPAGNVLLSSAPLESDLLPGAATVWLRV